MSRQKYLITDTKTFDKNLYPHKLQIIVEPFKIFCEKLQIIFFFHLGRMTIQEPIPQILAIISDQKTSLKIYFKANLWAK